MQTPNSEQTTFVTSTPVVQYTKTSGPQFLTSLGTTILQPSQSWDRTIKAPTSSISQTILLHQMAPQNKRKRQ
jgi:hypothetical protein